MRVDGERREARHQIIKRCHQLVQDQCFKRIESQVRLQLRKVIHAPRQHGVGGLDRLHVERKWQAHFGCGFHHVGKHRKAWRRLRHNLLL